MVEITIIRDSQVGEMEEEVEAGQARPGTRIIAVAGEQRRQEEERILAGAQVVVLHQMQAVGMVGEQPAVLAAVELRRGMLATKQGEVTGMLLQTMIPGGLPMAAAVTIIITTLIGEQEEEEEEGTEETTGRITVTRTTDLE